ncbi:MAG: dihydropteroate synthase [Chloroflexota bacterium]|nr:dihydropteroate synthase [Chloroflexota bacterium]
MYIIGENIHIISPKVKEAIASRDGAFFVDLARKQVQNGAKALDLNVGPQKKAGPEVMSWLVDAVHEAVGTDFTLSFDTTNLEAIKAGVKKVPRGKAIINSTSAEAERLEAVPLVAVEYGTKLIGLTMAKEGIPVSAEARVSLALEKLVPRMEEVGLPLEHLIVDPLVLTVKGCQEYVPQCVEAVRILKQSGLPVLTNAGLSNVSNQVPPELRPLINRTYMVMLMAVGLDMAIADPLDKDLKEFIRIVEDRDESTPVGKLLLTLHDRTVAGEEVTPDDVDMKDSAQAALWKTIQILLNKVIYADAYLNV